MTKKENEGRKEERKRRWRGEEENRLGVNIKQAPPQGLINPP